MFPNITPVNVESSSNGVKVTTSSGLEVELLQVM